MRRPEIGTPGGVYIYGLLDPFTFELKYIGQAQNIRSRWKQHCHTDDRTPRSEWIHRCQMLGRDPIITVLDYVVPERARAAENRWIQYAEMNGSQLVNSPQCPRKITIFDIATQTDTVYRIKRLFLREFSFKDALRASTQSNLQTQKRGWSVSSLARLSLWRERGFVSLSQGTDTGRSYPHSLPAQNKKSPRHNAEGFSVSR